MDRAAEPEWKLRRRPSLADAMAASNGGRFDQLRLAAALVVIYAHAFQIAEGSRDGDPFFRLSGGFTSGELAVLVFFALSGFLLAESWRRDPNAARFAARRARRLLPGLAACVLLLTFVVGPVFTNRPLTEYFSSETTWRYLLNIALVQRQYGLPGVFETAPVDPFVNASLWTLLMEVVCYGVLALVGALGGLRVASAALAFAFFFLFDPFVVDLAPPGAAALIWPLSFLGSTFFSGVLFSLMSARIPRDPRLAIACGAIYLAAAAAGAAAFGFAIFGTYVALFLATSRPSGRFRRLTRGADISYGVYLWGWPIQMMLVVTGAATTVLSNMLLGAACSIAAGAASWVLVERRFLRSSRAHGPARRDRWGSGNSRGSRTRQNPGLRVPNRIL